MLRCLGAERLQGRLGTRFAGGCSTSVASRFEVSLRFRSDFSHFEQEEATMRSCRRVSSTQNKNDGGRSKG